MAEELRSTSRCTTAPRHQQNARPGRVSGRAVAWRSELLAEVDASLADRVDSYRGGYLPEERRALEEVREMAKVFGDTVCKELDLQRPRSDLQRAEER